MTTKAEPKTAKGGIQIESNDKVEDRTPKAPKAVVEKVEHLGIEVVTFVGPANGVNWAQ